MLLSTYHNGSARSDLPSWIMFPTWSQSTASGSTGWNMRASTSSTRNKLPAFGLILILLTNLAVGVLVVRDYGEFARRAVAHHQRGTRPRGVYER